MFKHSEDRWPVFFILCLSALDFSVYFTVSNPYLLGLYFYAMIIPKSIICAWNHHHQHSLTFRSAALNRVLEFFYALHTGVTTNLWVLHHVYGHHMNYLDQSKDESRWLDKRGRLMGELRYSFLTAMTAYVRGFRVGKAHPAERRVFLVFTLITFAVVAALVVYKPLAGFLLFVLPMMLSLWITAWATYDHHAGLDTDDPYKASYNNLNRWYNILTGNLGYHTAHHLKGGLHWSRLPKFHEQIIDSIPEELLLDGMVIQRQRQAA